MTKPIACKVIVLHLGQPCSLVEGNLTPSDEAFVFNSQDDAEKAIKAELENAWRNDSQVSEAQYNRSQFRIVPLTVID